MLLAVTTLGTMASAICQESKGGQSGLTAAVNLTREDGACARCHKEVTRSFADKPHVKEHGASRGSSMPCAECHGPGATHIESGGDKSKILNPATAPARQVSNICLKCHAGKHVIFDRSAHARANVSCVRCHSIHASHEYRHLLTTPQPELCFECHDEQRPQFSAISRHKVVEGLILCTDCHEPHGSFGEQHQRSPVQQDMICTKCHTEVAGPFEYEHAIIKTEGCSACHLSHGGPNSHMLNRATVNTICLLCHFPSPISSTGQSLVHGHEVPTKGQNCIDCHVEIHGSNENPDFLKKKSAE